MYNHLYKLIDKQFYKDGEEATKKVDVFYACNKLTDEDYIELTALIAEKYPTVEPEVEVTESTPEV